jgi:membrane-associated protease RseP (regulator of RpoE activity)
MLRLILHTWSGEKKGFARTKIVFGIGLFILIAVLLSLFPGMVSNKVELDSKTEREVLNPEADDAIKSSDADVDAIIDSSDAGAAGGNIANHILYGKRISLSKDEMRNTRLRPIFRGEFQAIGLEIWRLGDGNVLQKLGLQKNDIIKTINGSLIQNAGDLENAIIWGVTKPRIDVEIERNNELLVVTYIVTQE